MFKNIVGGCSAVYEKELVKARKIALNELEESAIIRGGNSFVGIELDHEMAGSKGSMLMVTSETLVII